MKLEYWRHVVWQMKPMRKVVGAINKAGKTGLDGFNCSCGQSQDSYKKRTGKTQHKNCGSMERIISSKPQL